MKIRLSNKLDEMHLYLDRVSIEEGYKSGKFYSGRYDILSPDETYIDTLLDYEDGGLYDPSTGKHIMRTTIPHFLQFKYANTLVVHYNGKEHVITVGQCEGINREVRETDNIEKMLLADRLFDWF